MQFTAHLSHQKGFTLIELVIVSAIAVVLAEMLAQNFIAQMPTYRLNGAARWIAADLMTARAQAVSRVHNVTVSFPNNHAYTIWRDVDKDGVIDADEVESKDIQSTYQDVSLAATDNPMFNSRGGANTQTTITVTNASGSKLITINTAGFIKVQ